MRCDHCGAFAESSGVTFGSGWSRPGLPAGWVFASVDGGVSESGQATKAIIAGEFSNPGYEVCVELEDGRRVEIDVDAFGEWCWRMVV